MAKQYQNGRRLMRNGILRNVTVEVAEQRTSEEEPASKIVESTG
jgi:hypothetical protein